MIVSIIELKFASLLVVNESENDMARTMLRLRNICQGKVKKRFSLVLSSARSTL